MTAVGYEAVGIHSQALPPPILLITNSAASNPFGAYLAEILRAEGFNQFATKNLSAVTAGDLASAIPIFCRFASNGKGLCGRPSAIWRPLI